MDPLAIQAPFRAVIEIEDYQLLPLVKALKMLRVAMLIIGYVGLRKTIEAGLIAKELVLWGQGWNDLLVCPPSLCSKWQWGTREKFGLRFEIVDTADVQQLMFPARHSPRWLVFFSGWGAGWG